MIAALPHVTVMTFHNFIVFQTQTLPSASYMVIHFRGVVQHWHQSCFSTLPSLIQCG